MSMVANKWTATLGLLDAPWQSPTGPEGPQRAGTDVAHLGN